MFSLPAIVVAAALSGSPAIQVLPTQQTQPLRESIRESLRVPTIVFGAAAMADWITTHQALNRGAVEQNPMLKPFNNSPTSAVVAGMAIDGLSVWAWNKYVGKRHPKIAKYGLYAAAAFRTWIAISNHRTYRPTCHARIPEPCR